MKKTITKQSISYTIRYVYASHEGLPRVWKRTYCLFVKQILGVEPWEDGYFMAYDMQKKATTVVSC